MPSNVSYFGHTILGIMAIWLNLIYIGSPMASYIVIINFDLTR